MAMRRGQGLLRFPEVHRSGGVLSDMAFTQMLQGETAGLSFPPPIMAYAPPSVGIGRLSRH